MKGLSVNQGIAEAYEEKGGKLTLLYHDLPDTTRGKTDSGYFSALNSTFITEADQYQVVFRYNNSTIRATANDYGLTEMPDRDKDLYDVSLIVVTDLTPENKDDNLLKENDPEKMKITRIMPNQAETLRRSENLYNYRKLVFDGVHIDENVIAVYLDVFYVGDIKYNNDGFDVYTDKSYSALCVYDFLSKDLYRNLSNADKKAIESFSSK